MKKNIDTAVLCDIIYLTNTAVHNQGGKNEQTI